MNTFKKKGNKIRITPKASVKISENDGDGWRVDTLESSTSQIYLNNNIRGKERNFIGGMNANYYVSDFLNFTIGEEVTYVDTKSKRTAMDILNGKIDLNNTFDYIVSEFNNTTSAEVSYRDNKKQKGIASAMTNIKWINKSMRRNEYFPKEDNFPRTFNLLDINASLEYKLTAFNMFTVKYKRTGRLINILDLRETLDDTNPVILRTGNRDLKIPIFNSLTFSGSFVKKSATYGFRINYDIFERMIVDKVRYFSSDTYLPEYDYTATEGASLITKENLPGGQSLRITTNYSVRSKKVKSNLNIDLSYDYERIPDYINESRAIITAERYQARLGVKGNFFSVFDPYLGANFNYSNIYNGIIRNKIFSQTLTLNVRTLIIKTFEIDSKNSLLWNWQQPSIAGIDHFEVISNLSLGCRLNDELIVSATGYDIFNKRQRVTANIHSEYILSSYMHRFGRYIMLSIEWKL